MNLSLRVAFFPSPGLQAGVNGLRVHSQAVSTAFPGGLQPRAAQGLKPMWKPAEAG